MAPEISVFLQKKNERHLKNVVQSITKKTKDEKIYFNSHA